jgi:RNA polymerase primary sigma factor
MHTEYRIDALRELRDQQVRFVPREKKVEQVLAAEKLLTEIVPDRIYTYEYVCYRVTRFRPQAHQDVTFDGRDATHDLLLLVQDLSDAANVAAESVGERVITIDDLAKQFNVSTKTISRWRQRGLIGRRFLVGGRKRVAFLESSVNRFVQKNSACVHRGMQFRQLSDQERTAMIVRALRLSQAGGSPAEIVRRVARKTGRSAETIRYVLKQFELEQGESSLLADAARPLGADAKRAIYYQYHQGESAHSLSKRFGRTRASIYRIIGEMRARQLHELPLDYIPNAEFPLALKLARREQQILMPMPPSDEPVKKARLPAGLPPYLASLYEVPLLSRVQEAHLFRKMNFLKYKASQLRDGLDPSQPKSSVMDEIEALYEQAVGTKNQIIRSNLRLVVSIAKRHVEPVESFFELVSDGNVSLMRAVDKFDFARGFKFSTYASWAIMKNFARTIPDEHRYRDRFRTSYAEMFSSTEDDHSDQHELESNHSRRQWQVEKILGRLDEREQQIIVRRFGLQQGEERTLKEIGAEMGVTKERIRQLEARALSKLRKAAEEEQIEFPS